MQSRHKKKIYSACDCHTFPCIFFQLRATEMFFVWVVSDYGSEILGCSLNAQFLPSWRAEIEQDTSILAYFCFCLSFLHLPSFFLHVHYFFHTLLCKIGLFFVLIGDPRNLPLPASCRNLTFHIKYGHPIVLWHFYQGGGCWDLMVPRCFGSSVAWQSSDIMQQAVYTKPF